MRVTTVLLFLVSAVLPAVLSAPIPGQDRLSSTANVHQEHNHPAYGEQFPVEHRDHLTEGVLPPDALLADLHPRGKKKTGKTRLPKPQRITWEGPALDSLNRLDFHGNVRKQVKDYHKDILKQDMEKHGAHTAIIHQVEHPGGSDPKERLHITASYFDKQGNQIKSPWSKKKEEETGAKTEGHFHVYNEDQPKKTPMPRVWRDALAAAEPARLAKEQALAENNARQAKEKAEHIAKQQDANAKRVARQKEAAATVRAEREAAKAGPSSHTHT